MSTPGGRAPDLRGAVAAAVGRRLQAPRRRSESWFGGSASTPAPCWRWGTALAATDGASLHRVSTVFPGHRSVGREPDWHRRAGPAITGPPKGGSCPSPVEARCGRRCGTSTAWRAPLPVPGLFRVGAAAGDGRPRRRRVPARRAARRRARSARRVPPDGGPAAPRAAVRGACRLARDVFPERARPRAARPRALAPRRTTALARPPCRPAVARLHRRRARSVPRWLGRAEARLLRAEPASRQPWRSVRPGPGGGRSSPHAVTRATRPHRLLRLLPAPRVEPQGVPAHHPFLDLDLIDARAQACRPSIGFHPSLQPAAAPPARCGETRPGGGSGAGARKSYFDPLLVDCLAVDDRRA